MRGVYGLPPGADFPRLLVRGLLERMKGRPPEALARVELFVNTRRMQRRVREVFAEEGARLLPRLRLVSDPGMAAFAGIAPPVPPLRRRLELMQLTAALIARDPDAAPGPAAFDLADSLAALMDEMQGEGVTPAVLAALDTANHARHWQRSLQFIELIAPWFVTDPSGEADTPADPGARLRRAVDRLAARWGAAPPDHPVIVAGSTGSRGTTARMIVAVAALPQGALVLPGFDTDMPPDAWEALEDALTAEDHPQYRFRALLDRLGLRPDAVQPWVAQPPPCPARNRLVSLMLRPAPVTDRWMAEGAALGDVGPACAGLTLIEAATPRAEARAIALCLRAAAQDGRTAALITPDRQLTRQVAAALDRWRLVPDDSAGTPLGLTAPGRLLRQVAVLASDGISLERLIALLKHPLTHSGAERGDHLRHTRDLELDLRRKGPAFPDGAALRRLAQATAPDWGDWLGTWMDRLAMAPDHAPLTEHVASHLALTEALARGSVAPQVGSGALWEAAAGAEARTAMAGLAAEAAHGGAMTAGAYLRLLEAVLSRHEVREPVQADPRILIWGTLEARVQGADLVIAAGLNEGIWPDLPAPDPWLNRRMRQEAGLLLPERRIGLAAHDFQQAICAAEVVLSRALRDAEASTVPSRWVNRLTNLLEGLPDQGGPAALSAMRARGADWLALATRLEAPSVTVPAAPRPAPSPPAAARPKVISVTEIERLIRDPYAVYARRVLGLRRLDPLRPDADAALRGTVLHAIIEDFVAGGPDASHALARERLRGIAEHRLAQDVPWPVAQRLWLARLMRVADGFLRREATREGTPVLLEEGGRIAVPPSGIVLTARPDRIDRLPDGRLEILDYKTGAVPTPKEQRHFAKQLMLEAAMAEQGAFRQLGPSAVARVAYVGLGSVFKLEPTAITPSLTAAVWADLGRLLDAYVCPEQGFTARRAPRSEDVEGDFDHLARYKEWGMTDAPVTIPLAPDDEHGA